MSTETNKALAERLDAILNTGDLGQLDELCSPDMVNHSLAPRASRAGGHPPVAGHRGPQVRVVPLAGAVRCRRGRSGRPLRGPRGPLARRRLPGLRHARRPLPPRHRVHVPDRRGPHRGTLGRQRPPGHAPAARSDRRPHRNRWPSLTANEDSIPPGGSLWPPPYPGPVTHAGHDDIRPDRGRAAPPARRPGQDSSRYRGSAGAGARPPFPPGRPGRQRRGEGHTRRLDGPALRRLPEDRHRVAAPAELAANAQCRRQVAAPVPGDEHDPRHGPDLDTVAGGDLRLHASRGERGLPGPKVTTGGRSQQRPSGQRPGLPSKADQERPLPLSAITLCDGLGRLQAVPDGRQRPDAIDRQHCRRSSP